MEPSLEALRTKVAAAEAERDYYRQVAERLGRKTLSDAQDFSRMIAALRQGEEQLRLDREGLEKIVEERTAELVTANAELSASTCRYDELVQRIPNGVYTFRVLADGTMKFEYLSPRLCRIIGVKAEDMIEDAGYAFALAHPEDREGLQQATIDATRLMTTFHWEGRFVVRGEIRWICLDAEPTRTAERDVLWNGVLSDISDRKLSEEKLKVSEELYRHLTELAPNAITVADLSANIMMLNPKSIRLFGLAEETDAVGRSVFEWVAPNSLEAARQAFEQLFQIELITDLELTLKREDGSEFIGEVSASLLRNPNGVPRLVIITIADISVRKQAQKQLQMKNDDMEQFLYTVSHDLRSPLVTVKAFLGYLEADMESGNRERVGQDLQFIHSAADRMKLLLDELLELSRVDRVENPPVNTSLIQISHEVLDVLAGVVNDRKIELCLPGADVPLFGDRPRFCQIWQNLIENAIKYSHGCDRPRVEIGFRNSAEETEFFVKDNGIGIDPLYQDRIFSMFEKLDPGSPGAGIGLAMVRRIIEKFGGRIWVESGGCNTGSCFYFTLPTAVAAGAN